MAHDAEREENSALAAQLGQFESRAVSGISNCKGQQLQGKRIERRTAGASSFGVRPTVVQRSTSHCTQISSHHITFTFSSDC